MPLKRRSSESVYTEKEGERQKEEESVAKRGQIRRGGETDRDRDRGEELTLDKDGSRFSSDSGKRASPKCPSKRQTAENHRRRQNQVSPCTPRNI